MITADKLRLLTNFPPIMLTQLIQAAGYKKDTFTGAKFLGMTNANQFCYSCTYEDEVGNEDTCKVFVTYNPTEDRVSADY